MNEEKTGKCQLCIEESLFLIYYPTWCYDELAVEPQPFMVLFFFFLFWWTIGLWISPYQKLSKMCGENSAHPFCKLLSSNRVRERSKVYVSFRQIFIYILQYMMNMTCDYSSTKKTCTKLCAVPYKQNFILVCFQIIKQYSRDNFNKFFRVLC